MRKKTNTYSYFLLVAVLLVFTGSAVRLLHTDEIIYTSTVANGDLSIKNGIEKVTHSQNDAVDLFNGEEATAFFQDNQGSTALGASYKQKNLIDADDVTSLHNDHNAAILEINHCGLRIAGDLQKILLLFPFHSFW